MIKFFSKMINLQKTMSVMSFCGARNRNQLKKRNCNFIPCHTSVPFPYPYLPTPSKPMLILASLSVCRNNATAGLRAPGDHPTPTDSRPLLHLSRPTVISKDTFDCKFPFPTAGLFRIQVANFREKNASHHISYGVFLKSLV